MDKTILIPTDGSDYSKTALEYGIYIAKHLDAKLIGLHVVDIKIVRGPLFSDIAFYSGMPAYYEFLPKIEEALNKRGDKILETFRQRCEKSGTPVETRKILGLIDEVIVEEGKKADWILLAQRGEHHHLSVGGFLGSTTGAVVRKSKTPVMVTPADFREIESMGIAYDGSPPADRALKVAAEVSAKTKWPLTTLIVTDDAKTAADLTAKVEDAVEPYEVDNAVVVLKGKADREIMNFIKEGAVELMVMGAHSRGRLRELFLGSTTANVIRSSPIPALIVH
ncbi:MAG: universal stress protein [Syntrophobacterales bacterium]|nr:universal stress protein [Syntrophobacterales bacterium]